MKRGLAVFLLLALGLGGWWYLQQPAQQTARLRHVLPDLTALGVTVYRNQDWCRCFAYPGGHFMDSSHESTCALFSEQAAPFTASAQRDFDRIRASLGKARVGVLWITARYRADGTLEEAEFALDGWGRRSYVYHPNYGALPPDQGREIWHTAIDRDWYIRDEDWN